MQPPSDLERQGVLQNLERGMSAQQVRSMMGAPARTVQSNGTLQWMVYQSDSQQIFIYFEDGKLVAAPTGNRGMLGNEGP
jgi:outer membrane protein assembly factor BamE (lipoprotein component of BamABCDE complex)